MSMNRQKIIEEMRRIIAAAQRIIKRLEEQ